VRRSLRNFGKWFLRGVLVALVFLVLGVVILAAPFPLFAHKATFDEFTVHARQPLRHDIGDVIESARTRIAAMEYARPGEKCRVFICDSERFYSLFTFLARKSSDSMGLGLSFFGNVYLNETKIERVAAQNYAGIRHSRFEGDFAEAIAHEIAHFNVVKALGYRAAIGMPVWKSEGYAEYQANRAATRADSSYVFTDRIDLLRNDYVWGGGNTGPRQLFEWHLLVEFLADVDGFDLEDLIDESVTEAFAREKMLAWYDTVIPHNRTGRESN
jgi:hypothetical protein